jgi:tryptophanyl-tRNA synthetase
LAIVVIRLAVAAVGVQQVAALVRQHDAVVVVADRHRLVQPLFAEIIERVAHTHGIVAIEQLALGHDPERAHRRQRAGIVAVELVDVVAV